MLRLIIDGGSAACACGSLGPCVPLFYVNDTASTGSRGRTMTVVMEEGGGGSNAMAMEDAHRCFAACFWGGRGYGLETGVPRVGILKPKQEV